jgi:L-lactate dehydrogenase (cytochrome)
MGCSDDLISAASVQSHRRQDDCWIVVEDKVYDMTRFAREHPGGADVIYIYAGKDATKAYLEVHESSLIKSELRPEEHIGSLDPATSFPDEAPSKPNSKEIEKPPLETFINAYDFEDAAKRSLQEKSWTFISGASNDNISRDVSWKASIDL